MSGFCLVGSVRLTPSDSTEKDEAKAQKDRSPRFGNDRDTAGHRARSAGDTFSATDVLFDVDLRQLRVELNRQWLRQRFVYAIPAWLPPTLSGQADP